jgi:pyruvate formate lyase activating enzyme
VIERRGFLASLGGCAMAAAVAGRGTLAEDTGAPGAALPPGATFPEEEGGLVPRPARWFKKLPDAWVECGLCPHKCKVSDGERGTCGVRENRDGTYFTLVHSRPCSVHIDPVEKKPFFHVMPGMASLSLATAGCNFECKCCQNWEIAQARPEQLKTIALTPGQVAQAAHERGVRLLACTYTEPVVWSEYVYDIAEAGRKIGIRTLMISNGSIEEKPLADLLTQLAAVKIDLKAFTEKFYKEHCGGELKPVLDTLRRLSRSKTWFEIVVLVIPGLNDGDDENRGLARFVRDELGADVPVHFTRFHPSYRLMNLPPTPVATLDRIRALALAEGLRFVYLGNVPGHAGEHTYCPGCHAVVIKRMGVALVENRIKDGACPDCKRKIPGLWA